MKPRGEPSSGVKQPGRTQGLCPLLLFDLPAIQVKEFAYIRMGLFITYFIADLFLLLKQPPKAVLSAWLATTLAGAHPGRDVRNAVWAVHLWFPQSKTTLRSQFPPCHDPLVFALLRARQGPRLGAAGNAPACTSWMVLGGRHPEHGAELCTHGDP